jgi:hypothetical protein
LHEYKDFSNHGSWRLDCSSVGQASHIQWSKTA